MDTSPFADTLEEHRQWLGRHSAELLTQWKDRLANNPEAATAEAMTRHLLEAQVDDIHPAEDPP